jgi:hypothetical protein
LGFSPSNLGKCILGSLPMRNLGLEPRVAIGRPESLAESGLN